jgi:sigma-54 dependent transcriptional regulator, acetoin dehydrogenase operon transcriptional activator AcoR
VKPRHSDGSHEKAKFARAFWFRTKSQTSMTKQIEIRRAWQGFIESGTTSGAVRPVVLASWERSQVHDVEAERKAAPLAPEAELVQCHSAHSALVEAARSALKHARLFLADANSMIILTDPSGLILETAGDPRTVDFGHLFHLEQGGRWMEADIGTNAIGTAIAAMEPVLIHGAEHFCDEIGVWTCAATPIWHPQDGDLLGVVDISGPMQTFSPQNLALAVAVRHQIEGALAQSINCDRERLLRYFLKKRSLWANEYIVAIDNRGTIVYGAESALQDLERRHPGFVSNGRISSLKSVPGVAWPSKLRELLPNVSTESVVDHNRLIGVILVLPNRQRPSAPPVERPLTERLLDFDEILGESAAMHEVRECARRMALSNAPILIEGESGVGKELFVRAIHSAGATSRGPFVPVNCGGIPRDLIGSELFGYSKGAFTGAREQGHAGKIEAADGGLLCLDEIGEMPFELQPFLLRVLEDGVVYRIGSNEGRPVRVRLVSITNRNLLADAEAGRFRRDLYYRIAVLRLKIPPLRSRGEDIVLLTYHFARLAATRIERPLPRFHEGVFRIFRAYSWPGNVRELRNVVEHMILLGNSDELGIEDVSAEVREQASRSDAALLSQQRSSSVSPNLKLSQRMTIETALEEAGGNLTKAARRLGIARSTLYRKLQEFGIARRDK